MSTKWTVALCLAAGLLGEVVSRYLSPDLVHAQAQPPVPKEIRAQAFILEDENGNVVGRFTNGNQPRKPGVPPGAGGIIQLLSRQGTMIWSAPPPPESTFRPAGSQ
jgi:hypothetical protein